MKYVSLLAFKKIVISHPDLVSSHQDVIMSCIDDQDVSIRLQALDLSAGMVNKDNLTDLVNRLLQQLRRTPSARTEADDGRKQASGTEPVADSDGEDPEQILRLSRDNDDSASAIPPEYRIAMIRQILDMCAKDTYANITDFEWYIDVLVQLVGLLPPSSASDPKNQKLGDRQHFASQATSDDISICIGRELLNVAVRVSSVRPEAVRAAASLLLHREDQQANVANGSQGGGALRSAAWVVGEYAEQLSNVDATLTALTNSKVATLPSAVLCAYLQAIPKLLVTVILRASENWNAERQTMMSLLMARLLYFMEPLTMNPNLEVQERAVELAELVRLSSQAVTDHSSQSEHWPLFLTKAVPQLFGGSELNPVAPSAQGRIPLPNDLDLDQPLNSDLPSLLHRVAEDLDSGLEIVDFQAFYTQRPTHSGSREPKPAVERLPASEPETSSYQNTDGSYPDSSLLAKKRLERRSKNKDDPFYIPGDETSSGASTPFHDIMRTTNGEGVDVDSIPIMNLDLGDNFTTNKNYSESEQQPPTRKKKKAVKKYKIATDENIDLENVSEEPQSASATLVSVKKGRGVRDTTKKSLLEVDSSGLGGLMLDDHYSSHIDVDRQESEDIEMAKALQEVERLRLEMQRASERVQVSDGLSPEGTLVKKKKMRKKKVERKKRELAEPSGVEEEGISDHEQDDRHADPVVASKGVEEEDGAPVVKKKKKKKKEKREGGTVL